MSRSRDLTLKKMKNDGFDDLQHKNRLNVSQKIIRNEHF